MGALEERVAMMHKLAQTARDRGHEGVARLFDAKGDDIDDDVQLLHDLITKGRTLEQVQENAASAQP